MKGKAPPKKRANGNDDQQDQSRRKSARLAAGPSTSAITTETVCQASDSDGSSEEEVVPVAVGMPLPSTQGPSTSVPGTQYAFVNPTMLASNPIFFIPSGPMTSHVPEKTQNKIRAGSYVMLSKLLYDDGQYEDEQVLAIKDGSISLVEKHDAKVIATFSKFFDAFVVYMAIRGAAFPNEYLGMLRHMEIVKKLISQGNDGILYDKQFRIMRGNMPQLYWGQFMAELVTRKTQQGPSSGQFFRPGGTANNDKSTNATCRFFNSEGSCTRKACRYKHECSFCHKKSHGQHKCWKKNGKKD